MEMSECPSYETCNANLCPLDPDLSSRCWYIGEDVCSGRAGSGKRWVKKQRGYNKRQPKSYMNKALSYRLLYDNSRPKVMTDAQREALQERGRKLAQLRHEAKIKDAVTMPVEVG